MDDSSLMAQFNFIPLMNHHQFRYVNDRKNYSLSGRPHHRIGFASSTTEMGCADSSQYVFFFILVSNLDVPTLTHIVYQLLTEEKGLLQCTLFSCLNSSLLNYVNSSATEETNKNNEERNKIIKKHFIEEDIEPSSTDTIRTIDYSITSAYLFLLLLFSFYRPLPL